MLVKRILPIMAGLLLTSIALLSYSNVPTTKHFLADSLDKPAVPVPNKLKCVDELRSQLSDLSPEAFDLAIKGYHQLLAKGTLASGALLAIADYSLPSDRARFFVVNLQEGVVQYQTLVAHGKNSGERYATRFSNKHSSLQSSLGFFKTGAAYQGSNGNSLRLIGLEKGVNDQALVRGIVLHGAPYVNEELAKQSGWIGRSWGCPAVPASLNDEIIKTLQQNQCLFIYHPSYRSGNL